MRRDAERNGGPVLRCQCGARRQINVLKMRGTPMRVAGVIRSQDGAALVDALVEIWHCDAEGNYHPFDEGDVKDFKPQQLNLRGVALTDNRGRYAFESIVPAQYSSRRRHIH